ncbi:MAG: metallophosphoesterase [Cyanobacteria bacterium SBLK]|nr:metallophosphoesterase [Cyanobacteria bacterium SBLK]
MQSRYFSRWLGALAIVLFPFVAAFLLAVFIGTPQPFKTTTLMVSSQLLSDPFLQLPSPNSVRVVWFTEFRGSDHRVVYGDRLENEVSARTTKLTRVREDKDSRITPPPDWVVYRDVWRHEAEITGLQRDRRLPYRVVSTKETGEEIGSDIFSLAPTPSAGKPLKILLTSDHQLMPMTTANLQKVEETIGKVDAVFLAGDLINIPDRASEWFDSNAGNAFFPALQGRARYTLKKNDVETVYKGGQLIQHAPLFPAIGNHEVMGRFSLETGLNFQYGDAYPQNQAEENYQKSQATINPGNDPQVKQAWVKTNSFNTDTYEEIFTLPQSDSGGEKYYAVTFGDIHLIVLYVTNIWRSPTLEDWAVSRYRERSQDLNNPERWGYGQLIFEPITPDSQQYQWLVKELKKNEFLNAKYKIVMFHHPPHTLGDNIVPPYTNPRQMIVSSPDGTIRSVRYEYPLDDDYIQRYLEPLFNEAGVQLVYYGHSHLWNRFQNKQGVNFLESSNVGNTYGAFLGEKKRPIPQGFQENYVAEGDPNGLEPILPAIAPLKDENNRSLPYISSNDISVFSILDTERGTISSYRFDTTQPNSDVIKFDEFSLLP